MAYQTVIYQKDGPTAVITMNRPEKYNALSMQLLSDIKSALEEAERDGEVRAVIITGGSDKFFSTGADLNEALQTTTVQQTYAYMNYFRSLNATIERHSKAVIAAISGYCLTGGCELAMACDLRIAAENAQFGITSVRIGSVAGAGGTQRLPRLVGLTKAKELLFTSQFIDAQEASRIGLVNKVVPAGQVLDEAKKMAAVIAEMAPISIKLTKLAVNSGMQEDLNSALDLEAGCTAQAFTTEDKKEGMSAFLEKRKAVFKGR